MIQIAVCDDNIDELSHTIQLIDQYRTTRHTNCEYAVFQNGFELISALEKGKRFDLYCLDIIMPAFSGIEVAKEIRRFDKNALILFFTSSSDFALESYSVRAINYVLKPLSKETLFNAFDEILERIIEEEKDEAIIVKSNEGIQKILIANLVVAEVNGRNIMYHLRSGKVIDCIDSFASVCETLLKFGCFIKTHRSFIVNMRFIDTIGQSQVTMQTDASVPIAQGRAREIKQQYLLFQMEGE